MRIIRYKRGKGLTTEIGIVTGDEVYSLKGDPIDKFEIGRFVCHLDEVVLLAPCIPKKIVAMAINFPGIEGYSPYMKEPLIFIKPGTCVSNPNDIVLNPFPDLPWWGEAELAVVIKKNFKNASLDEVHKGILGFTIANDVTVENIDGRDHHLARSKCPDGFCPVGPWIDTEFNPEDCLIEAIQNNEVIRRGRSSEQVWKWDKIIQWLSTWMTLEPWDIILTGNPPDTVGMRYLSHGDKYTARIDGLGEITNTFIIRGLNNV